jgi:DMSO/TMAO reductase YedYZ molybdopterin-dependent catalytic subunit/thiosulfate reductase cytochrome b subunit
MTDSVKIEPPRDDPIESTLSSADDRIALNHWLPPQWGAIPHVRLGRRWINTLWIIPIGAAGLVLLIAIAQSLRELSGVQAFIRTYPGISQAAPSVDSGFPVWLQVQHFLNMLFMMFIIRAGIQILADHPRLYWNRDCTPGTEWFRFQRPVPEGRIWTAKDDSVTLPGWLGIPGLRHSIGLARWWHFSIDLLWVINGVVFYVLLFATGQWLRLIPVTWSVFPNAVSTAIQYASLNFPVDHGWTRYNGLQQLSYFITVFIAAPVSITTGLLQSPAISNRLGLLGSVLNRQVARSIHFISFLWFIFFILAHGIMVFITGIRQNTNHMFAGVESSAWVGFPYFVLAMIIVALAWWVASPFTIRNARLVQKTGRFLIGWLKGLSEWWEPTAQMTEQDISPHFWPNGTMPSSEQYDRLVAEQFASYRLRVGGLVEHPREFSLADLKAMRKQEQITTHFCIQGWSGVAKWGGVPMRDILDLVKPLPEARYVVFYSLADGSEGGRYYDVHETFNMRHRLTILAYEMNNEPVSVLHGAPLRLRCENELGFKMVKWIAEIELVRDFAHLGAGQGGYNEDHEFYGYRMPI